MTAERENFRSSSNGRISSPGSFGKAILKHYYETPAACQGMKESRSEVQVTGKLID
jgi:hypothetical protein